MIWLNGVQVTIDFVPRHGGIQTELQFVKTQPVARVRVFRRVGRLRRRLEYSAWSDWCDYDGTPLQVTWESFW